MIPLPHPLTAPRLDPSAALRAWPLALACLALMAPQEGRAQATGVPSAGQLLEEARRPPPPALPAKTAPSLVDAPARPTVTLPEGVTVAPTGFRISGATSFPAATLAELVQPWVGRRLDIQGLNDAAGAITRHYQGAGHLLSYAYLPAQRVADGVIEIAVLEGRLDAVQIVAAQDTRLRDSVVQAYTAKLVDSTPVLQSEVERALLMLNDIPGVAARAAFTPGASTGAAEMVVSVAEDEPLEVRAEINNHGTRSTGVLRAGLGLQLRDVFGWGDSISARGLVSRGGGLVSGTLAASLPMGGEGWKWGASLTRLRYELAGDFRALGGVGTADALGLDASYALRRSLDTNVTARASYEHKRLRDELQQLLDTLVIKRNDVYELSFSFDDRDAIGGTSAGSLALAFGSLQQRDTREPWRRLSAQLARQQALFGPLSLYLRATGQTTGSPLDSSEKLALAGPGAVRAYAAGEATVDRGAVTTVELRYAHDYLGGGLVWSVFHDQAKGEVSRAQVGLPGNRLSLHGSGLAMSWSGSGLGLNAALAWRGSRLPTVDGADPSPRVILQLFYTP